MPIYTGGGDDGTTSLFGGERVAKHALRMELIGTIDELRRRGWAWQSSTCVMKRRQMQPAVLQEAAQAPRLRMTHPPSRP